MASGFGDGFEDARGKVFEFDAVVVANIDSLFDCIFEFVDVARPGIVHQEFHGFAGDLDIVAGKEQVDEFGDVENSSAQWRQFEQISAERIKEVGAKAFVLDVMFEVFGTGSNDADIEG